MPTLPTRDRRQFRTASNPAPVSVDDDQADVAPIAEEVSGPEIGTTGGVIPKQAGTWDKKPALSARLSEDSEVRARQSAQSAEAGFEAKQREANPFLYSGAVKKLADVGGRRYIDRAIQGGEAAYGDQVRADRAMEVARRREDIQRQKNRNAGLEEEFRSTGRQFYTDAFGDIKPITEASTGKALFHATPWQEGVHPKTGLPTLEKRDQYGQRQFKTPPIVASPDLTDDQLYYKFADDDLRPAGKVEELVNHPDFNIARTAKRAASQRRQAMWKEAIAPLEGSAAEAVINHDLATQRSLEIQANIDALTQQSAAFSPEVLSETQGGVFGVGGSPTPRSALANEKKAAIDKQIESLATEQAALNDDLKITGKLGRARRAASLDLAIFKAKAQHENYADLADERRLILRRQGKSEADDPTLKSILQAQAEYGATLSRALGAAQREETPAAVAAVQAEEPPLEPAESPNGGAVKQAAKSFARGALAEGIYSAIEGGSRALASLLPEDRADSIPKSIRDTLTGYANATALLRNQIRKALPVDEKFGQSKVGQISQGLGQAAGTLPLSVLGPAATLATSVSQIYDEGYQDAIQSGASPEQAHQAAMKYLPAASLDYLSDRLIIGKLLKPLKGKITVRQILKDVLVTGAAEGGTEGAQQGYLNWIAKTLEGYDPNRTLDKEVLDSIIVGAVVGGGITGGGLGVKKALGGNTGPIPASQKPVDPAAAPSGNFPVTDAPVDSRGLPTDPAAAQAELERRLSEEPVEEAPEGPPVPPSTARQAAEVFEPALAEQANTPPPGKSAAESAGVFAGAEQQAADEAKVESAKEGRIQSLVDQLSAGNDTLRAGLLRRRKGLSTDQFLAALEGLEKYRRKPESDPETLAEEVAASTLENLPQAGRIVPAELEAAADIRSTDRAERVGRAMAEAGGREAFRPDIPEAPVTLRDEGDTRATESAQAIEEGLAQEERLRRSGAGAEALATELSQQAEPIEEAPAAEPQAGDRERYDALQAQMAALGFDKVSTPEFQALWRESETIKNRNGGMPPGTVAGEAISTQPEEPQNAIPKQSPSEIHVQPAPKTRQRIRGENPVNQEAPRARAAEASREESVREEVANAPAKKAQRPAAETVAEEPKIIVNKTVGKGPTVSPEAVAKYSEPTAPSSGSPLKSAAPISASVSESTPESVEGEKLSKKWTAFSPESGTLGIPRNEMPQIRSEARGALVNFMKARGIEAKAGMINPTKLKPTQAEYSPEKVQAAREYAGSERPILISSDNHVIDGHHQWVAALDDTSTPMPVIRLNAPIDRVLGEIKEFPSSEQAKGVAPTEPKKKMEAGPAAPRLSDRAIAALQKAKIDTKGKAFDVTGAVAATAWNSAIDISILAIRAGRTVADAVKLAITRYKAAHPKHTTEDLTKLESAIRQAIETPPEPAAPKKEKSRLPESLKEAGAPVESIEYLVRSQEARKQEASDFIKANGREKAEAALSDPKIPGDTRVAIGGQLLNEKMLSLKEVKPEEVGRITRDIQRITAAMQPELATEAGQTIAMHAAIYQDVRTASAMEYIREAGKKRLEALGGEEAQQAAKEVTDILNKNLTPEEQTKAIEKLKEKFSTKPVRKFLDVLRRIEVVKELNSMGVLTRDDLTTVAGNALGLPGIDKKKLKHLAELADRVENAKNHAEMTKASLELADTLEIYKGVSPLDLESSILTLNVMSGYTTQLGNLAGNTMQAISNLGSAAITNPSKVPALTRGLLHGIPQGITQAKSILQTGRGSRDFQDRTLGAGNALKTVDYARDFPKLNQKVGDALTLRARLVEKIGRAMKAADAVFYYPAREAYARMVVTRLLEGQGDSPAAMREMVDRHLHVTPEAFQSATKQARDEGYDGIDLARRTSDIIEERRGKTVAGAEAVKQSEKFAAETTLNNEPVGLAGVFYRNAASLVGDAKVGGVPILKPWLMFLRVPTNVFNATTNYTPVGAIRARFGVPGEKFTRRNSDWKNFNKDERNRLYLQSLVGTTLMAGLLAKILKDDKDVNVTASGPDNASQKKQLMAAGWRPYSVKVGGKYISYRDSPLLVPLAIVGHVADSVRYQKAKSDMVLQSKVVDAIAQSPQIIFQTSMLSSFADLMSGLSGRGGSIEAVGRTLSSVPANLAVPYNRLFQQIDQTFDSKSYDTNPVLGAVPFARRTGEVQTDVQGRDQTYQPVSRFGGSESSDAVDKILQEKNIFIPEVGKEQKIGNRAMTDEERTGYRRVSGQRIRARIQSILPRLRILTREKAQDEIDTIAREERARIKPLVGVTIKK